MRRRRSSIDLNQGRQVLGLHGPLPAGLWLARWGAVEALGIGVSKLVRDPPCTAARRRGTVRTCSAHAETVLSSWGRRIALSVHWPERSARSGLEVSNDNPLALTCSSRAADRSIPRDGRRGDSPHEIKEGRGSPWARSPAQTPRTPH